jgi:8-amino-7-oxononanoate synthase
VGPVRPAGLDRLDAAFGVSTDLDRLRSARQYRSLPLRAGPQGTQVYVDGQQLVNFCSNDYLGFAADGVLIEALRDAAARHGVGSGAAALLGGRSTAHAELENSLCRFLQRDQALLFSSGYLANLAVVTAFAGRGDLVVQDRLNHASLIDGALLSRARLRRYAHCDAAAMGRALRGDGKRKSVFTDAVFSMDGDLAPLRLLSRHAADAGALLAVDDAHGLGVLGANGGGLLEVEGLGQDQVPILIGTFGKAFGVGGAFVAGPESLIDFLRQHARSYIYTTAPPPALAAVAVAALDRMRAEPARRERLKSLVQYFCAGAVARGLPLSASKTPIQPLIVGESGPALDLAQTLRRRGYWVAAIRPPTVPLGSARLRITLSAGHTGSQVDGLLDALAESLAP